jgi:hypothetical protein
VSDPLYGKDVAAAELALKQVSREVLVESLLDIYTALFCYEGEFNPECSKAADSASDFVEACDMVFQRIT